TKRPFSSSLSLYLHALGWCISKASQTNRLVVVMYLRTKKNKLSSVYFILISEYVKPVSFSIISRVLFINNSVSLLSLLCRAVRDLFVIVQPFFIVRQIQSCYCFSFSKSVSFTLFKVFCKFNGRKV